MFDILEYINKADIKSRLLQTKELTFFKINSIPELKAIYEEIKNTDVELYEHSMAVADISGILGIIYNLRLDELISLYLGAVLHDNGKTLLNQEILYKPATFSSDEKQLVEAHTSLGGKRIKHLLTDKIVSDIILKHHERVDGTGYPDGRSDNEQTLFIKIVAVADVFHALISKRCYKDAISIENAIDILEHDNGFDKIIVKMLKSILSV